MLCNSLNVLERSAVAVGSCVAAAAVFSSDVPTVVELHVHLLMNDDTIIVRPLDNLYLTLNYNYTFNWKLNPMLLLLVEGVWLFGSLTHNYVRVWVVCAEMTTRLIAGTDKHVLFG